MTDSVITAIDLVAQEDGADVAAEQAAHELGCEAALEMLVSATNDSYGPRCEHLMAVVGELRKQQAGATEVEA